MRNPPEQENDFSSREKRGAISNATDKSNLQFNRQSNPEQEV
jgi:hypothetical protein